MVVFPAITLSQPNYSYGCFVVGVVVVVVVGLLQQPNCSYGCFVVGVVIVVGL